ncbi:MAG: nucleotidyltransferase family protein, partial [Anaerolineales bacterium]|nr:nucleotidyltransferase family protein [Anaerolineales bacterium]
LSLFTRRALQYARPSIPPAVLSDLTESSQALALRSLQQVAEIQRVLAAFQGAGIPVIVLKGLHLRLVVYQDSMLRSMSDLDLLVAEEYLEWACLLLKELGYTSLENPLVEANSCHRIYTSLQARFPIEVHWKIEGGRAGFQVDTPALWGRAQPLKVFGVEVLALAPEDLILHLGKHTFKVAALRSLVDLAESLDHFGEQLDWSAIEGCARQWRVSRSLYLALTLARQVLDAAAPDRLWSEVAQDSATPPMLAFTRTQIERQLGGEKASYSPRWARFWQARGWGAKLRALGAVAFPSRAMLAHRNRAPFSAVATAWRMPLFYLGHWVELVRDKLPILLKLARRSPAAVEKMETAAQYDALRQYMRGKVSEYLPLCEKE